MASAAFTVKTAAVIMLLLVLTMGQLLLMASSASPQPRRLLAEEGREVPGKPGSLPMRLQ